MASYCITDATHCMQGTGIVELVQCVTTLTVSNNNSNSPVFILRYLPVDRGRITKQISTFTGVCTQTQTKMFSVGESRKDSCLGHDFHRLSQCIQFLSEFWHGHKSGWNSGAHQGRGMRSTGEGVWGWEMACLGEFWVVFYENLKGDNLH